MKKYLFLLVVLLNCLSIQAKYLKISVDMTGWQLDSAGVCLVSDFQTLIGDSLDWEPGLSVMTQEPNDTNIYSLLVNIPAHRKYEFKFVNAAHWYGMEFVPEESRVIYNFNDNRWFYLDSISNDTAQLGAIPFSGNAPVGKKLLRFRVDMSQQSNVNPDNVHIIANFQNWDPTATTMYSFDGAVYEHIAYVDSGNQFFRFINGNNLVNAETVPLPCAVNNDRIYWAEMDIILPAYCFNACTECVTAINEAVSTQLLPLYPNPTQDYALLSLPNATESYQLLIFDSFGRWVREIPRQTYSEGKIVLEKQNLTLGIYYVQVIGNKAVYRLKWQVN